MKNIDIMSIVAAYQKGTSMKLPAAVAWKRRVNMDKLFRAKNLIEEALQEARLPFLDDEHSIPSDNGGRQVKPEFVQEFVNAQNEILAQETEIDIKKIPIDDLGDIEMTDGDMDTIAFMIEGGE